MLKFKEALYSNKDGGVIISLEDGRCALVDTKNEVIDVDVFVDTYLKWGNFDNYINSDDIEKAKKVLQSPKKIFFSQLANDYLNESDLKKEIDRLKKEAGYNY